MATMGSFIGAVVGVIVFAGQEPLTRLFTADMAVICQVTGKFYIWVGHLMLEGA